MEAATIYDKRFEAIAQAVAGRGGSLFLAGGLVRDTVFAERHSLNPPRGAADADMVCMGLDLGQIQAAVSTITPGYIIDHRMLSARRFKEPFLVSARIEGAEIAIAIARKISAGEVVFDISADLSDDARCRDFTVNAVYYDPIGKKFVDPLGAASDFQARRLELCHPSGLSDDPVRILRAMGLISRLGLTPSPGLLASSRRHWPLLAWLPAERLWPEWRKWALSGKPRLGLEFLREGGAIGHWPALEALIGSPQYSKYHPEGDVWNHTLLVVQSMGKLSLAPAQGRVFLTMAALLHDIGKPLVTYIREDGRAVTAGHGPAGLPLVKDFFRSVSAPGAVIKPAMRLIAHHMDLSFRDPTSLNLRILARRLAPFCDLTHFWAMAKADWDGRSPNIFFYPWTMEDFLEPVGGAVGPGPIPLEAKELMAELGLSGGPTVGQLMEIITDSFDRGEIVTNAEALELAARCLADPALLNERTVSVRAV